MIESLKARTATAVPAAGGFSLPASLDPRLQAATIECMGYDTNVYSSPEEFGLEIVCTADVILGSDYDKWLALRDPKTGELFWAADSGCSCPAPFDDYGSRVDLHAVGTDPWVLRKALDIWSAGNSGRRQAAIEASRKIMELVYG